MFTKRLPSKKASGRVKPASTSSAGGCLRTEKLSQRISSDRLVMQPKASLKVLARPAGGISCHKRSKDAIEVYWRVRVASACNLRTVATIGLASSGAPDFGSTRQHAATAFRPSSRRGVWVHRFPAVGRFRQRAGRCSARPLSYTRRIQLANWVTV